MTRGRALILGVQKDRLFPWEEALLRRINPWGFILFARNIKNPEQVRNLTDRLREITDRHAPILIDQEGGRVARFKPPHWRDCPPMGLFERVGDLPLAIRCVRDQARLIGWELAASGVNMNCAPVCDLRMRGGSSVIGDRAFSRNPERVAMLAGAFCEGLLEAGVLPIIKHIPGHGRGRCDSHQAAPRITTRPGILRREDFLPFQRLAHMQAAMTGHVILTELDSKPATFSTIIIERIIRQEIGFQGMLISDDLEMGALTGTLPERIHASLAAGCDVALISAPTRETLLALASDAPELSEMAQIRAEKTVRRRVAAPPPPKAEQEHIAERINTLCGMVSLHPWRKSKDPTVRG